MKTITLVLLLAAVIDASAEERSATEQLSDLAAKNIAAISSSLSQHQRIVNDMVAQRADAIVQVYHLAAVARVRVDRELTILANTKGDQLVKIFDDISQQGAAAALAPQQVSTLENAVRAEVMAAAIPGALSVEKLDAAAKKLALLAKERPPAERFAESARFFRDTKTAADKLQAEAETKANAGAKKIDTAYVDGKSAVAQDQP